MKGNGPGGDFTGKTLREMIAEDKLLFLEEALGEAGHSLVEYLRALRGLYQVLVQREVDPQYQQKIEAYKAAFEVVHLEWGLPETPKLRMCNAVF